jgi:hypothetical protein
MLSRDSSASAAGPNVSSSSVTRRSRSRSSTALAARRASRSSSPRVAVASCASRSATCESPREPVSRSMFWISTLMTGGIRPPAGADGVELGLRRRRPRRRGGRAGLSGVRSFRSVKASRHEQTMAAWTVPGIPHFGDPLADPTFQGCAPRPGDPKHVLAYQPTAATKGGIVCLRISSGSRSGTSLSPISGGVSSSPA